MTATSILASVWSTVWVALVLAYLAAAVVWYVIDRRRPREDRKFAPLANAVMISFGLVFLVALLLAAWS